MAVFTYPFRLRGQPELPIVVTNPHNGFDDIVWGLIDTGAEASVIPKSLAKQLYHDIENPQVKREVNFGLGGEVVVFMHSFNIEVLVGEKTGKVTS